MLNLPIGLVCHVEMSFKMLFFSSCFGSIRTQFFLLESYQSHLFPAGFFLLFNQSRKLNFPFSGIAA